MSGEMGRLGWLSDLAPRFRTRGSAVRLLASPGEYYDTLNVSNLERTIAARRTQADFRALVLLDYGRALRGPISSVSMLRRLLQPSTSATASLQLYLFHTPRLRGLLKWLLPDRWNEVLGVQHMKIAVFDDSVLLSGANLSDSYFTNRQDRYVLVEDSPYLADFYEDVVRGICRNSFRVQASSSTDIQLDDSHMLTHPYKGSSREFCAHLRADLESVVDKWRAIVNDKRPTNGADDGADTFLYPTLQMGVAGVEGEDRVMRRLFTSSEIERLDLASGYFNLTRPYSALLIANLASGSLKVNVLAASPKANGFWNGSGISGYVPTLYVQVAKEFFFASLVSGLCRMYEWAKSGWTFHGKGLWLTFPGDRRPSATVVGSSNFGYRSVHRDLESQLIILTKSPQLQEDLEKERDRLMYEHTEVVTADTFSRPDHIVPFWVRLVSKFFRRFF